MTVVVGVDGCSVGWVAARLDDEARRIDFLTFRSIRDLIDANEDAAAITIDIPIGLVDGPRACDTAARKFIGPRASSVFAAPSRAVFPCATYADARAASVKACGRSLSAQGFAMVPKIREVDDLMTPTLQERVREIHPEVCFRAAAGRPMEFHKRKPGGFEERVDVLRAVLPWLNPVSQAQANSLKGAGYDDVLDAAVAAYTALRIANGTAQIMPVSPDVDSRGLRMEMVY